MEEEIKCRRCETPVEVWGYGKSFAWWAMTGLSTLGVGILLSLFLIGVPVAVFGAIMLLVSPLGALSTKNLRECDGCNIKWPPRKDKKKALR